MKKPFAAVFKKYGVLLFIAGLLILSISQQKLIMPIIYDVVSSDLFLVDSKDQASSLPISTPLSNIAFMHCNNYIKSKASPDETMSFMEKPLKAWSMGNYQYIINAEINITSNSTTSTKKYTCRITYNDGDNEENALNVDSWSIIGVSDL